MMTDTTPDLATLEAERGRIRAQHLRPAGERPASSARGLHHTALVSSDVERTVRFYQDVLEFPLTELIENRDYPGSSHFFFDIGNGNLLAFFDFPGLGVGPYAEVLGGLHHMAISVDPERWAQLVARLTEAGVPHEVHSGVSVYFRDPDGARIELIADPLGEMYGSRCVWAPPPPQKGPFLRRGSFGSLGGGEQVGVVGVPLDPAADERALGHHAAAARPDVVQRAADQRAAQPRLPGVGVDLGVGEHDRVTAPVIGGQAEQLVAVADLVPVGVGGIAHGGLHGHLQRPRSRADSGGQSASRSARVGQRSTARCTSESSRPPGSGRSTTRAPSSPISKTSGAAT